MAAFVGKVPRMDQQTPTPTPSAPIPAATVVLMRDRAGGAPELLMLERARAMAFAGGALVFPGGRIDPADHTLATLQDRADGSDASGDPDDVAARIAAVRETLEEAGVAVGLSGAPSRETMQAIREALADGVPLAQVLAANGLSLALNDLVPFARWCPQHSVARIFDTRFYLVRAPEGADAIVDATENVRLFWGSAQSVLDDADAGRVTIIYPTRRNLERLARYRSFDEAAADARAWPIRTITPWQEERDGGRHLCIPDDLGYPITSELLTGAMRG